MLALALDESLRRALASGLRALEERVALADKLRRQSADRGHTQTSATWSEKKLEYEAEADVIRQAIRRADDLAAKAA